MDRGTRNQVGNWRAMAVMLLLVTWTQVGSPVRSALAQDDDPLAWRRVDTAAVDVEIVVEDKTAGRTRRLSARRLLEGSDELYMKSAIAADLLRASRLWQATTRRLTLRIGEGDYRFEGGSRLVAMGEREVLMPVPVLHADGELWLPMAFVTGILAPESGLRVSWKPDDLRLSLGQVEANVTGIKFSDLTRATSLRLDCREPLSFRASSPEAGIIELKIYGAQGDLPRLRSGQGRGLIRSVAARQLEGHLMLTVRVDDLVDRYRAAAVDDGAAIVLTVEEEQVAALPDPVPRGPAELVLEDSPRSASQRRYIRTVVIDPGHGGNNPGVESGSLVEKEVNLAVAKELARDLRRRGFSVVLTRDRDLDMSLSERAEIANAAGGDLFISLHCNGWFNDGARGLETYFLSPAKSDWSKSVETVENQGHSQPGDVEFIVWDLVQNQYIAASSDLAEVVQSRVTSKMGMPDRGVRQAGFRVLVGAWMPAILLEMGFLTHAEEAAQLGRDRYRRDLAGAIGQAIAAYRDRVAGVRR